MKRFLAFILIVFSIFLITGCGKVDKNSIIKKMNNDINKIKGYQVEAELELISGDDSYKYDVIVSYKKKDNYRVALMNKNNNHEQIILKNKSGVYILTPDLNKSFKFQSNWPYNNSQGYMMHSVIKDLKNDPKVKMKKTKDGYVFTSKVNYKNNANLTHQNVVVDKDLNIKSVTVLDDDENAQMKIKYKSIDKNAKFKDNYFVLEENMKMSSDKNEDDEEESASLNEAVYPMYLPEGTYLDKEKVVDLDGGARVILTFSGEKPFMLIEETAYREDEFEIVPTSGDIEMDTLGVAIVDDTSVNWVNDDIEYYLVSSNLSKTELLQVARSISSMPISK